MRAALNTLATVAPEWLLKISQAEWVERYSKRVESSRLPESKEKQEVYANQVGLDGQLLLQAVYESDAPEWLSQIPVVDLMRQVWLQQYWVEAGKIHWRTDKEGIPPASCFISSPYDPDAHYARKYTNSWIGYKVHITETCEEDLPNLITNGPATMPASGPLLRQAQLPMAIPPNQSMNRSKRRTYCLPPTLLTLATWMPDSW